MNEYKITCDICRDLIPLVNDGVASEDSAEAVKQHAAECKECAALLDGTFVPAVPPSESPRTLKRLRKWLNRVYTVLMILGIFVGCCLTSQSRDELLYNCLIMPVAGVFGYLAFRWRAFFTVPVILLFICFITNALGTLSVYKLGFRDILSLAFIYSLFALAGSIITMLFKFAFSKNSSKKEGSK